MKPVAYIKPNIQSGMITYRRQVQYDPTRTASLRNLFAKEMARRFKELEKAISEAIIEEDVFGLSNSTVTTFQVRKPGRKAFQFLTKEGKVAAFMEWLNEQINKGLLETRTLTQVGQARNAAWTDTYIQDSYKRGVIRSRYELGKISKTIPPLESTGGIFASMATPFHADRVGMLYIRAFEELKDITSVMSTQISKVLSQGMIDGDGPRAIARKLIATIQGGGQNLGITDTLGRFIPARRRAEILARTEVIRAHHSAMVQEYRNWGLEGVKVKAEWQTAEDDRVCPQCLSMEGKRFTLDQIENMIPAHPMCRCIALPDLEE